VSTASIGIDPNQLIRSIGLLGLFVVVFAASGLFIGSCRRHRIVGLRGRSGTTGGRQ
jgi:hypothetical protein